MVTYDIGMTGDLVPKREVVTKPSKATNRN